MGLDNKSLASLVQKPPENKPCVKPSCKWEDNIRRDFREIECGNVNWTEMSGNRVEWWNFVVTVMHLLVLQKWDIS
jgi:hypothetical protein